MPGGYASIHLQIEIAKDLRLANAESDTAKFNNRTGNRYLHWS